MISRERALAWLPEKPVAQLRWVTLAVCELMLLTTALQFGFQGAGDPRRRLLGWACLALLAGWWPLRCRRGHTPAWGLAPEAGALLLVTLAGDSATEVTRLIYVALFFRALHGRESGWLAGASYALALLLGEVVSVGLPTAVANLGLWMQIGWLIIAGGLFYRLASRLLGLERSREREQLLRTTGTRVATATAEMDGLAATDGRVRAVLEQSLGDTLAFSGLRAGRVYLSAQGGATFRLAASTGDAALAAEAEDRDAGLIREIVDDGVPRVVSAPGAVQPAQVQVALRLQGMSGTAGVLVLEGPRANAPGHQDLATLQSLCGQLASLVDAAHLRRQLQHTMDSLRAIYLAGRSMNGSLRAEEVGQQLFDTAGQVLEFQAAAIRLRNERGQPRLWLSRGDAELAAQAQRLNEVRNARRRALLRGSPQLFVMPAGAAAGFATGWCLPLKAHDRDIGTLELFGMESLASVADIETLESLTGEAAIALENASLYGQLEERERRLHDLVGRLLMAQEEERRRISYELHDGFVQLAASAHLHVEAYSRHHSPRSPAARQDLEQVRALSRQLVLEARDVIAGLRPTVLDDFGLVKAIQLEIDALQAQGWVVSYAEELGNRRLPPEIETTLFRVAQEGLRNALKHAHTKRAAVALRARDNQMSLEVRDWGRGFRLQSVLASRGPSERVGLAGMQERLALVGGRLIIRSTPGEGTRLLAEVPLRPALRAAIA